MANPFTAGQAGAVSPLTQIIAPDVAAQQLQLARQQQMADILRQQALEPSGDTQVINGWAIKKSPFEPLARMLQGYMAGSGQRDIDQKNLDLSRQLAASYRTALNGGQPSSSDPSSGDAAPGLSPSSAAAFGNPALATPDVAPQAASSGQPSNSNLTDYANLIRGNVVGAVGGDQAAAAYYDRFKQTPEMKNIAAAYGENSPQYNQALQDTVKKSTYIAPTRLGEGAYADNQGNVHGLAPSAPPGFINNYKADGSVSVEPIANGLNALAQSTGAKTGAEEANKIINVKTASGATVPMWAGNAVGSSGTGQNAPSSSQSAPMPQTGSMNFPGLTRQQVMEQGMRIKDPNERAQFMSQFNQAPQVQDNQNAWATMPKMPQPNGIGQSTFGENMQKGAAETAAKLSEKYGTSADSANQRLALNKQALDLVDTASTGAGASMLAPVQNALIAMGVPESAFNHPVSDTIALQKDLVNAATAKAKQQFGARITQSEVNLMLSRGSPNVDMPKAALKYLLQSDNAAANYQIQQANDLGKYIQNGGDPYRFEGWYSQNFPLSNSTATVKMDNGANSRPATNSKSSGAKFLGFE